MDKIFSLYIYWDLSKAVFPWNIPIIDRPILWYGLFFAIGFFLAYQVFQGLLKDYLTPYRIRKRGIVKIAEKMSFFVVIGALLGARLGDVLFYQNPIEYVQNPLGIFKFWDPGLSSHGGVIGILIALGICARKMKKKYPMMNFVAMMDLMVIPALLAGAFIRIGNFFNQEILGVATKLPWGVIFGHPVDGLVGVPRHPVQIYEALFYLAFFGVLLFLRKQVPAIFKLGRTSGLFFMGTFLFRFLVEFLKVSQSALLSTSHVIDMGQWLSLPLILVGCVLFFCDQNRLGSRSVKGH